MPTDNETTKYTDLDEANLEIANLRTKLTKVEKDRDKKTQEWKELNGKYTQEINKKSKRTEPVKDDSALIAKIAELEQQLQQTQTKEVQLLADKESLSQSNNQLERDKKQLQNQLAQKEQELAELQVQLASQPVQSNNNDEEVANLQQRIAQLERELKEWLVYFPDQTAEKVLIERNTLEFQRNEYKDDVDRRNGESQKFVSLYKKMSKVADNKIEHIGRLEKQIKQLGATPVLQAQIELK